VTIDLPVSGSVPGFSAVQVHDASPRNVVFLEVRQRQQLAHLCRPSHPWPGDSGVSDGRAPPSRSVACSGSSSTIGPPSSGRAIAAWRLGSRCEAVRFRDHAHTPHCAWAGREDRV